MITYEIQLRCVIRDKIQSETKFSLSQNPVEDKIREKYFLLAKHFYWEKVVLDVVLDFQCVFF